MSAIPAPDEQATGYADAMPGAARGGRLGLALVVIASAQLMVVLDATIVIALGSRGGAGAAGAAVVLLVSFVLVELRNSHPLHRWGCSPTGTGLVPT